VVRGGYEFGVPAAGVYDEVFNTDADCFGGGNVRNGAGIQSRAVERHGRPHSISITLPPLAVVAFRRRA
jgi:1,4-alpha-glucan branching enzyme